MKRTPLLQAAPRLVLREWTTAELMTPNPVSIREGATVAEAVTATLATPVVTVMPRVINRTATNRTLQIPAEAGYGVTEVVVEAHIPAANRD